MFKTGNMKTKTLLNFCESRNIFMNKEKSMLKLIIFYTFMKIPQNVVSSPYMVKKVHFFLGTFMKSTFDDEFRKTCDQK